MLTFVDELQPYVHVGTYQDTSRSIDLGDFLSGELVVVFAEATVVNGDPVPGVTTPAGWSLHIQTGTTFTAGPLAGTPIYYKGALFSRRLIADTGSVDFLASGALDYRIRALRFSGGGIGRPFFTQWSIDVPTAPASHKRRRSDNDAFATMTGPYLVVGASSGRNVSDGSFLPGAIGMSPAATGTISTAMAWKTYSSEPSDTTVSMTTVGNGTDDYNVLMSTMIGPGG